MKFTHNRLQAYFAADQKSSTRFFRGPFTNGAWVMVVLYFALLVVVIKYARWLTRGDAMDNDIHADALWALSSLCVKGERNDSHMQIATFQKIARVSLTGTVF